MTYSNQSHASDRQVTTATRKVELTFPLERTDEWIAMSIQNDQRCPSVPTSRGRCPRPAVCVPLTDGWPL